MTLVDELSVTACARMLGVDRKTVLRYIRAGQLPARDVAPAGSTRARLRVPVEDVRQMRNGYQYAESGCNAV